MTDPRRALPSVSTLLERPEVRALMTSAPRALVVDAVRDAVDAARRTGAVPHGDDWAGEIRERLASAQRPSLRAVINATGVVLHTNLGRAPLAEAAIAARAARAIRTAWGS